MIHKLRPRTRKQWIIAIVGATFGLCLLCGFVGALMPNRTPDDPPAAIAPTDSRAAILEMDTPTPRAPTNTPSLAATPEPSATSEPSEPAPTNTPEPTNTPLPPTPTPALPSAAGNANLRAGPGTDYPIAGGIAPGQPVQIIAANPDGDWYQLASGAWIAAFLVDRAPAGLPIVTVSPPPVQPTAVPTAPPLAVPSNPAAASTLAGIRLLVIQNASTFEILAIRNDSPNPVDISSWTLYGSRGDETCVIPGSIILQPGEAYQIATGDSQPTASGYKCGDKTIWNNEGEIIYLRTSDGQTLQIST